MDEASVGEPGQDSSWSALRITQIEEAMSEHILYVQLFMHIELYNYIYIYNFNLYIYIYLFMLDIYIYIYDVCVFM
jgi:hypothetical protein